MRVTPDPDKHVIAHVFKVAIDPYVAQLRHRCNVHQGIPIRQGSQFPFVGDARQAGSGSRIFGGSWEKIRPRISAAIPGDLCALAKLDELHLDAVLHDLAR